MVEWEYLEGVVVYGSDGELRLIIPQHYVEIYKYTPNVLYTLSQLGKDKWSLSIVITNIVPYETKIIFKRPQT